MNGKCPKCGELYTRKRQRTEHHIVPRRLGVGDTRTVDICDPCHVRLEEYIRKLEYRVLRKNIHIYRYAIRDIFISW